MKYKAQQEDLINERKFFAAAFKSMARMPIQWGLGK
jgi:hypothetical protein